MQCLSMHEMKEEIWTFLKLFSFLFYLMKQKSYKQKSKNAGWRKCLEITLITAQSLSLQILLLCDFS